MSVAEPRCGTLGTARALLKGHLESMVTELRDHAQEALGRGRPSGTARRRTWHRRAADSENFEFRVHAAHRCEGIQTGDQLPFREITRIPRIMYRRLRVDHGQSGSYAPEQTFNDAGQKLANEMVRGRIVPRVR
jgi:hypothetical protein